MNSELHILEMLVLIKENNEPYACEPLGCSRAQPKKSANTYELANLEPKLNGTPQPACQTPISCFMFVSW